MRTQEILLRRGRRRKTIVPSALYSAQAEEVNLVAKAPGFWKSTRDAAHLCYFSPCGNSKWGQKLFLSLFYHYKDKVCLNVLASPNFLAIAPFTMLQEIRGYSHPKPWPKLEIFNYHCYHYFKGKVCITTTLTYYTKMLKIWSKSNFSVALPPWMKLRFPTAGWMMVDWCCY